MTSKTPKLSDLFLEPFETMEGKLPSKMCTRTVLNQKNGPRGGELYHFVFSYFANRKLSLEKRRTLLFRQIHPHWGNLLGVSYFSGEVTLLYFLLYF